MSSQTPYQQKHPQLVGSRTVPHASEEFKLVAYQDFCWDGQFAAALSICRESASNAPGIDINVLKHGPKATRLAACTNATSLKLGGNLSGQSLKATCPRPCTIQSNLHWSLDAATRISCRQLPTA